MRLHGAMDGATRNGYGVRVSGEEAFVAHRVKFEEVKRYLELNGYDEADTDYPPFKVFYKTRGGRPDEPILFKVDDENLVAAEDWERIKAVIIRLLDDTEN